MTATAVRVVGRKGVFQIPRSEIKTTFYVRKTLNEDRVLFFMELYDSGAEVPPLKLIRGTNELFDGRHRDAALNHLGREHAECEYIDPKDREELIVEAFGANLGGAMPPTRADVLFVMVQLINGGTTKKRISEMFAQYYPASVVRKYMNEAQSTIAKAKMQKAVQAVAIGNMTAQDAAAEHSVDLEKLKEELSGVRRKKRSLDVNQIKGGLSSQFRSNSGKTRKVFEAVLDKYSDGELSQKKVDEILDHVEDLVKRAAKNVQDWRNRIAAMREDAQKKED